MRALVVLSFFLAGCSLGGSGSSVSVDPADLEAIPLAVGSSEQSVALQGGPSLRFILDVPEIEAGARVPLVIAMPYAGEPLAAARQYHTVLARPGLARVGAIVVVPVAFTDTWETPEAISAVTSFVEAAVGVWPVDPERVVVTGYSNGGNGTWRQAREHADLYSAAIPMGSYAPSNPPRGVPLYIIHGENDELFPVARAREAAGETERAGVQVEFEALPFSHFEAGRYAAALARAAEWVEREVWAR